ncbi:MAG: S41 family peptidase [Oscillospiraceae bacterium]|nr:S41 family peptidase [Oscillospiraceae bacterium]
MKHKTFRFIDTLALMLLASALTLILSRNFHNRSTPRAYDIEAYAQDYVALIQLIDDVYIGDFDIEGVTDAAMRAIVSSLGDRWSFYMTANEYAEYLMSSSNQFTGIGVGVAIHESTGGMEVLYTYKDSPAEIAGLSQGDVIISIDGNDIRGFTISEMRVLLSRPIGDTALLDVIRADGNLEEITVAYDIVFSNPVSFELIGSDIGYVSISNFEGNSGKSFVSAIEELLEMGAVSFIYDVRDNGGGMVHEMTEILDFLLPAGEIFISVNKTGRETITRSDARMHNYPAVVIVNRYSYSAAEYFAALLREYEYAKIVGEQTTGKSRSQTTILLPNGGALHISTGQYFTKNRVALYDVGGLTPDYELSHSSEEYSQYISGNLQLEDDPQILLAISVLRD